MKETKVLSPATVANFVCGFDVLGFALSEPCDEMTVRLREDNEIKIINLSDYDLPTEVEKNVAGAALIALQNSLEKPIGFEVEIKKNIKPGSGIGSSAASAGGAVAAANHLLNNKFSKHELVAFAMSGEVIASGVKHADNVAPCVLGGVTLVRSSNPLDVVTLTAPPLFVTILHPQIEIRTSDARAILSEKVLLKDAVKQWGNVAALVAGLMKGDYDLIGRSMEDYLIEPVRKILIPAFDEIKTKSQSVGALGGGISGSGPSIFMLSKDKPTAEEIEREMIVIYRRIGVEFHSYVTSINNEGVKLYD